MEVRDLGLNGHYDVIMCAPVMVALTPRGQNTLNNLNWELSMMYVKNKSMTFKNHNVKWLVKIENISSIEVLESEAGELLKITFSKNERSLLIYGATTTILNLKKVLSTIYTEIDQVSHGAILMQGENEQTSELR
jgi:hypothetical protein